MERGGSPQHVVLALAIHALRIMELDASYKTFCQLTWCVVPLADRIARCI